MKVRTTCPYCGVGCGVLARAVEGGAVAAWPLATHAQQAERLRRVGVLSNILDNDPQSARRAVAFEKYRKGTTTATTYPEAEKAKLSDTGK